MMSLLQRLNISFINSFFHPINLNGLCVTIVQLNGEGRGVLRPWMLQVRWSSLYRGGWDCRQQASGMYKYRAIKLRTAKTPGRQRQSETKPWVYSGLLIPAQCHTVRHRFITVGRKLTKRCWTSVSEQVGENMNRLQQKKTYGLYQTLVRRSGDTNQHREN